MQPLKVSPTLPQRSKFTCYQHRSNAYVSFCMSCKLPLCVECQNSHTLVHCRDKNPAELRSMGRVQEDCGLILDQAIQICKRDLQAVEMFLSNGAQFEMMIYELDLVHRSLVNDLDTYFHSIKVKCQESQQLRELQGTRESLVTKISTLGKNLRSLNQQVSPELLGSIISDKFTQDVNFGSQQVETVLQKTRRHTSSVVVHESELQKILQRNIERFIMNSKYLKPRNPIDSPLIPTTILMSRLKEGSPDRPSSRGLQKSAQSRSPFSSVDLEAILRQNTSSVFRSNPLLAERNNSSIPVTESSIIQNAALNRSTALDTSIAGKRVRPYEESYSKLAASNYWSPVKGRSASTSILARKNPFYTLG